MTQETQTPDVEKADVEAEQPVETPEPAPEPEQQQHPTPAVSDPAFTAMHPVITFDDAREKVDGSKHGKIVSIFCDIGIHYENGATLRIPALSMHLSDGNNSERIAEALAALTPEYLTRCIAS